MGLIQTAVELSDQSFSTYEADIRRASGTQAQGAVFNRVIDRSQKGIDYARSTTELDAIAQFFFPDVSASMTAATLGSFSLSMGLPGPLVADMQSILCLQNTVIEPPKTGGGLKRMSILRKRPEITAEEFQRQWFGLHAVLVPRLPGIQGYRQNLVIDGPRDPEGNMLADGMVELWFEDGPSIERAFQSGPGHSLMMHAQEFIAEISTFLVEPHRIHGIA